LSPHPTAPSLTYTLSLHDALPISLHEDRLGQLWIGTFNGGVSRFFQGKFTCYKSQDGLPGNGVLDIYEDSQGNLWMGTWNGLARYRDGKFVAYSVADGLAGPSVFSI